MKEPTAIIPKKTRFDPFAGPEIVRVIHTTQSQAEIWIACQLGLEDANRAYNESISLQLNGELNQVALEQALKTLVQRHESLRAVFSTDGRFMTIFDQLPTNLLYHNITDLSPTERKVGLSEYLKKDAQLLFDLVEGPLLRASLIKITEVEHRLMLTAHHIICDGWSLGIMLQELGALYSANVHNRHLEIPSPESFSTYADGQLALMESEDYPKIERFWLRQYQESVPQLNLQTDFPRPSSRSYKSERLDFTLDANLLATLKKTGIQQGCSLVTTLLVSFEVFLYRLTGQDDIVVGLPTAGQSAAGMTQLVGHCVNLLPLRSRIRADIPFTEYLKQRKSELFDAYEHQQLSFGQLLQKLSVARDPSRVPLVPVVFNIDMGLTDGVSFTGLSYELISNPRAYESFELFLNATGSEDSLVFEWSYNTALFKPATIRKMMDSFEEVLRRLVAEPANTVGHMARVDHSAYAALNATEATYPRLALHELLVEQALASPNRLALKFRDTEISYQTLHERANQMAHYLMKEGMGPGDLVGVSMPRSLELPITLLAIMQCGAAYIPLDPDYPKQRLEFMLTDSEAKFLVTTTELSTSLHTTCTSLFMDDISSTLDQYPKTPVSVTVQPDDIAYLLYTSGSTGMPKGVPVAHKSLVNLMCSIAKEPGIHENDKLLAITTISFDIAAVELFLPLSKGACTVMADTDTVRDGRLLLELMEKEEITILQATPTTWQMLLDSGWDSPFKLKAFCGGEALSTDLAGQLLSQCDSLWNMYGPTETTIYSIIDQITSADSTITIGRPIANTQVYLLNEQHHRVAPGVIGEIGIAGDGVAKGYWKRPELTREKFIRGPIGMDSDTILYRTGDLGVLLPSGVVQCLGRTDQQVKIRGHRIEPGEIERALTNLDDIHSAVVLAHEDRLVAHIVPTKMAETTHEQIPRWRKALVEQLPAYSVPQEFRTLKTLPTTPNGKLNRRALLDSTIIDPNCHGLRNAPRTDTEKLVAEVWEECLGLEEVDIFTNFFELGGHSLLALRVMVRLENETGKRLPPSALFEYSSVAKLALLLDTDEQLIASDALIPIQPKGSKIPLYLIHGVGLNVMKFKGMVGNLDDDQPVYGLQGTGISGIDESSGSVEKIAAHYIANITTANPEGPYALAGHSYGGIIAYEMARQLIVQGKEVTMLAMLDSYVEPFFYYASPFRKKAAVVSYRISKFFSLVKEMSGSWKNFKFHLNRKKEFLLQRYSMPKNDKTKADQLEYRRIEEVDRMNYLIVKPYRLLPQDFEIDLFRAEKNTYYMHDPIYLGWNDVALKGVHVHEIPGNHLDFFTPPNDKVTAGILQNVLDRRTGKAIMLVNSSKTK